MIGRARLWVNSKYIYLMIRFRYWMDRYILKRFAIGLELKLRQKFSKETCKKLVAEFWKGVSDARQAREDKEDEEALRLQVDVVEQKIEQGLKDSLWTDREPPKA